MNLGIELAKAFMRGQLEPFAEPVEDSEQFIALLATYSERSASIESAVMELAHGSCHALTLALSDALGLDSALVITDAAGMPVHSGLYNTDLRLILDANGVHTIDEALNFWSRLAGGKCDATQIEVDDLYSICSCDEDEAAIVLEDFALIADFIQAEIIAKPYLQPAPAMRMG